MPRIQGGAPPRNATPGLKSLTPLGHSSRHLSGRRTVGCHLAALRRFPLLRPIWQAADSPGGATSVYLFSGKLRKYREFVRCRPSGAGAVDRRIPGVFTPGATMSPLCGLQVHRKTESGGRSVPSPRSVEKQALGVKASFGSPPRQPGHSPEIFSRLVRLAVNLMATTNAFEVDPVAGG
jgi:hypothetical protein